MSNIPSADAQVSLSASTSMSFSVNLPPELPQSLWEERKWLGEIRRYALSMYYAPDAMFYSCLVRTAAQLPLGTHFDSGIITTKGSLNLGAVLVGPAGAGKTSALEGSRAIVQPDTLNMDVNDLREDAFVELPLSTGEGISEAFLGFVKDEKGEYHRKRARNHALFSVDEGAKLHKLSERKGATIFETIRSGIMGVQLGEANASAKARRIVEPPYHAGFLIGYQPSTIQPLLAMHEDGTPARFLFASAMTLLPDVLPNGLKTPEIPLPASPQTVTFVKPVMTKIKNHRAKQMSGRLNSGKFGAHAQYLHCKVAALFVLLDGRTEVTADDWRIAGIIVQTSLAVAEWADCEGERAREELQAERFGVKLAQTAQLKKASENGDRMILSLSARFAKAFWKLPDPADYKTRTWFRDLTNGPIEKNLTDDALGRHCKSMAPQGAGQAARHLEVLSGREGAQVIGGVQPK